MACGLYSIDIYRISQNKGTLNPVDIPDEWFLDSG